jgi:bifunctional DNA primase/polymerase-like protein
MSDINSDFENFWKDMGADASPIAPAEGAPQQDAVVDPAPSQPLTPEAAAAMLMRAGYSFVPAKIDGSKRPSIDKWEPYQTRKPTAEEITGWYGGGKTRGIAVLMGEISGNAETLDFDKAELFEPFCAELEKRAPGLLARLLQIRTPRPGYQITYRCKLIGRNRGVAFAERPATDDDIEKKSAYQNDDGEWVLRYASIETRGEGGYCIGVGSPPRTHKMNRPYVFLNADYERTPMITLAERDLLFEIGESLSELPITPEMRGDDETECRLRERKPGDPLLPGDDFNERGDIEALLKKHGWSYCGEGKKGSLWARPGKEAKEGSSATLFSNGNLYVFSSNAHPLPQCTDHAITPFSIYTIYEHKGDFKAAAKALAEQGYGDRRTQRQNTRSINGSKNVEPTIDPAGAPPATDTETAVQEVDGLLIEPIELFDGKLVFTIVIAPRGRAGIEVYKEGEFVYEDEIYLPRATQRTRFINKIAKMIELPEGGSDDIERALLQKSKEIQDVLKEESKKKPEKKSFKPGQVYCPYHESEQGIVWEKPIMGSGELDGLTQPVTLTNFNAKVLSNITRDDGTELITVFEIAVGIVGEPSAHKGTVRADQFSSMGWPVKIAGSNAVIYAGKIEHARAAIQLLSKNVQKRYVIAHTGWRNDNEEWLFYHGAGAIGAKGLVQVDVELPPSLKPCSLPPPPKGQRLREVVRAVAIDLRQLGPDRITLPSIGSGFAAVLTGADFSLFLLGTTGKFKTELAAIIQSFFGKDFDDKHLPADWKWTALSIQETAHIAKDMVCVVDDFVPKGTPIAQARMHEKGETVMRGQANGSGRGRCNPDGTVRPERPPRGLLVVTGEDLPHGQSLVARMLALPVEEGDISAARLTACQEKRRQGVYAEANSAFIQWLASDNRIAKLKKQAPDKIHELRTVWAQNGIDIHKKVANTLAQLERAWSVWLDFALESGGITSEEKAELSTAVHSALDVAGREHARFLGNENPATRFIELLKAAISSGRAYLAAPLDNGVPSADADVWGWEREVFRIEGKVVDEWQSKGDRIGWIEGNDVYLQPDAAYKMAQSMGTNGEGLTISSRTLWRRMKEEGLLATRDAARETNTIRKTVCAKSEDVIHVYAKNFFSRGTP